MGVLTPEVKQLGHEADHSIPYSTKAKNMYVAVSPILQHIFKTWCLIKQAQGQLHLYLTYL